MAVDRQILRWLPGAERDGLSLFSRLLLRIGIHQRADHALIGHAPRLGGAFEEIDAAARERQRDLHVLLARHQRVGRGQEILHDAHAADFAGGLIGCFLSSTHNMAKLPYICMEMVLGL